MLEFQNNTDNTNDTDVQVVKELAIIRAIGTSRIKAGYMVLDISFDYNTNPNIVKITTQETKRNKILKHELIIPITGEPIIILRSALIDKGIALPEIFLNSIYIATNIDHKLQKMKYGLGI